MHIGHQMRQDVSRSPAERDRGERGGEGGGQGRRAKQTKVRGQLSAL